MTTFASRELAKVLVRLPDGMREKLKDAAKKQKRTMNAEIVKRLEFTFDADVVAHDLGYDVGLSIGTPEWTAAIAERDEASTRLMSDADLDYIADKLAKRLGLSEAFKMPEAGERLEGGSKLLLQNARKK